MYIIFGKLSKYVIIVDNWVKHSLLKAVMFISHEIKMCIYETTS